MTNLDREEKGLLESYERDEWRPVKDPEQELKCYGDYARAAFKKDVRVNIRISS